MTRRRFNQELIIGFRRNTMRGHLAVDFRRKHAISNAASEMNSSTVNSLGDVQIIIAQWLQPPAPESLISMDQTTHSNTEAPLELVEIRINEHRLRGA